MEDKDKMNAETDKETVDMRANTVYRGGGVTYVLDEAGSMTLKPVDQRTAKTIQTAAVNESEPS